MPAGKIHAMASIVTAASAGAALYFNNLASLTSSCNVAGGALLGVLVSPDLDLMENGNYSMVILRARSYYLAEIWRLFWWPYARLSKHRGVSHWPIIGTLLRVIYIIIIYFILAIVLSLIGIRVPLYFDPLAPYIAGLMLADFVHIVMDSIF